MIITLTFDDEKEGELEKFNKMMKAEDLVSTINDVVNHLRNRLKYDEMSEEKREGIEEVRETICKLLEYYQLEPVL